jgi:hypothetical protein
MPIVYYKKKLVQNLQRLDQNCGYGIQYESETYVALELPYQRFDLYSYTLLNYELLKYFKCKPDITKIKNKDDLNDYSVVVHASSIDFLELPLLKLLGSLTNPDFYTILESKSEYILNFSFENFKKHKKYCTDLFLFELSTLESIRLIEVYNFSNFVATEVSLNKSELEKQLSVYLPTCKEPLTQFFRTMSHIVSETEKGVSVKFWRIDLSSIEDFIAQYLKLCTYKNSIIETQLPKVYREETVDDLFLNLEFKLIEGLRIYGLSEVCPKTLVKNSENLHFKIKNVSNSKYQALDDVGFERMVEYLDSLKGDRHNHFYTEVQVCDSYYLKLKVILKSLDYFFEVKRYLLTFGLKNNLRLRIRTQDMVYIFEYTRE